MIRNTSEMATRFVGKRSHLRSGGKVRRCGGGTKPVKPENILGFPVATPRVIVGMEEFCLLRWRWSLRTSFFPYLRQTYGVCWRRQYTTTQRNTKKEGGGDSTNPRCNKRRRLVGIHDQGGTVPLDKEVTPEEDGVTGGTTCKSVST